MRQNRLVSDKVIWTLVILFLLVKGTSCIVKHNSASSKVHETEKSSFVESSV